VHDALGIGIAIPIGIQQSDLAGNRLGRQGTIAGDHRHPDAGVAAGRNGGRHLGARGVDQSHQPHEAELLLQRGAA